MANGLMTVGLLIGVLAGGGSPPPARDWSGDVSRDALGALLQGSSAEVGGSRFTFGVVQDEETWESFSTKVASSAWSEGFRAPGVSWSGSLLVYVAHDGATHMLRFERYDLSDDGTGELVFSSQLSRRGDGEDGPCSAVVYAADRQGLRRVVVKFRSQDGNEILLGELTVESK